MSKDVKLGVLWNICHNLWNVCDVIPLSSAKCDDPLMAFQCTCLRVWKPDRFPLHCVKSIPGHDITLANPIRWNTFIQSLTSRIKTWTFQSHLIYNSQPLKILIYEFNKEMCKSKNIRFQKNVLYQSQNSKYIEIKSLF